MVQLEGRALHLALQPFPAPGKAKTMKAWLEEQLGWKMVLLMHSQHPRFDFEFGLVDVGPMAIYPAHVVHVGYISMIYH